MADPFVKGKYKDFEKLAFTRQGPSFLERMTQDQLVRKTIDDVNRVQDTAEVTETLFRL